MSASLYDFSPLARLLVTGFLVGCGPLLVVYWRQRDASAVGRLHGLALMTLFLTFDLVLFGAFTRLTDSGLGCPDWPGCYGAATPLGASSEIAAAQQALPSGPVTLEKAWIEMVHRILAMAVGFLILVLAVATWLGRKPRDGRAAFDPWWPAITLVWVCVQGAFGAGTVTMKLFPAIVTLHLLGGYVLLALLTVLVLQFANYQALLHRTGVALRTRLGLVLGLALLLLQSLSGAWVSTNYAVLACSEFPMCQGSWWPMMDFTGGFEIWRPLGLDRDGAPISFQALTAIHFVHRLMAMVTVLVLAALAWSLRKHDGLRKQVRALAMLLALQLATGLSNVVLDWPIVAAVLHTGGAGAMVGVLVWLLMSTRTCTTSKAEPSPTNGLTP